MSKRQSQAPADVIGALGFAARNQLAANDDAASGETNLFTNLPLDVPTRLDDARRNELGADIAFAEVFFVHLPLTRLVMWCFTADQYCGPRQSFNRFAPFKTFNSATQLGDNFRQLTAFRGLGASWGKAAKKLARDLKRTSRLIFVSSASTLSDLLEPQANQLYIGWMELLQRLGLALLVGHRNWRLKVNETCPFPL